MNVTMQRGAGLLVTGMSFILLYLFTYHLSSAFDTVFLTIFCAYLLVLALPGLLIDLVFSWIGGKADEDIAASCGGLKDGGYLIGYMERSLIFLAVLIAYYDATLTYSSILSFLSVIVAGKAIFRYSSKEENARACADWYILGTLMSITAALSLTWYVFRFLLPG